MISGSPLKKCWKPGMFDKEELNYLIVIDDDKNNNDNFVLNYLFSNIQNFTYEKSVNKYPQLHLFWKSLRFFIEHKHIKILNNKRENLRVKLLSSNIYDFVCYQEMLFQKIDL